MPYNRLESGFITSPIYNKMAIFPAFKYMLQSDNGKAIYDRMNEGMANEIDMLALILLLRLVLTVHSI